MERDALFDVSHVTAVVTGGGTGIGLMITQALVANGAKVYITGRRQEKLEQCAKLYGSGPGSIHPLPADVSDKKDVLRIAKELETKEPKGIQLLVNNAGIARDQNTGFGMSIRFSGQLGIANSALRSEERPARHVRRQGHL